MRIWVDLGNGIGGNMDNRDKEIEYLEDRIKDLEKIVEYLSKPKRKWSFGEDTGSRMLFKRELIQGSLNPRCAKCGTENGVDFMEGLDVNLCDACKNNWN